MLSVWRLINKFILQLCNLIVHIWFSDVKHFKQYDEIIECTYWNFLLFKCTCAMQHEEFRSIAGCSASLSRCLTFSRLAFNNRHLVQLNISKHFSLILYELNAESIFHQHRWVPYGINLTPSARPRFSLFYKFLHIAMLRIVIVMSSRDAKTNRNAEKQ